MANITFAIENELKERLAKFGWVNWSEIAREAISQEEKTKKSLKSVQAILSKSKFTEKDAKELSDKVRKAMHEKLKKEGLV